MKKILFAIAFFVCGITTMNAQDSNASSKPAENYFMNHLFVEMYAGTGAKSNGMQPMSFGVNIGYELTKRLYMYGSVGGNISLYEKGDAKTFYRSPFAGGGVGVKLIDTDKITDWPATDIRLAVTNSIGNADWKHTIYDASVILYKPKAKGISPTISLGYKYMKSHSTGIKNYGSIYGTIGIRF